MDLLDLVMYYVLRYYAMILALVFVGSLIANLAMELGLTRALAKPFNPLLKAAKMPEGLSAVLALSLIDSRVAHAALSTHFRRGELSENHVVACFLLMTPLGAVPLFIRHYAPIAYAALGLYVATLYLSLIFIPLAVRALIGVAYSRRLEWRHVELESERRVERGGFKRALNSAVKLTKDVAIRLALVTLALILMSYFHAYEALSSVLTPLTSKIGLSAAGASIVAIRAVSPSIGLFVAGDLLQRGVIGVKEGLISLLMGSLLFMITSDYPRHAFPFYASVYPVKLAAKLTAIGMAISSTVLSAVIVVLALGA